MTRRRLNLLTLLTLLSLLLFLTTVAVWVRSYRTLDDFRHLDDTTGRMDEVVSRYGAVEVARVENMGTRLRQANLVLNNAWRTTPLQSFGRPPLAAWEVFIDRNVAVRFQFLGFQWLTANPGTMDAMWGVRIPLWLPASAFALLPALSLFKRLRRPAHGHCPRCGYDLRATPGRCPECGTPACAN